MAARAPSFICQNCGAAFARWAGKCEACGEWNTLIEEGAEGPRRVSRKGRLFAVESLRGEAHEAPRLASGIAEFDRVTGGGLVRGSVLLLGGDPGIGKSTLLIEVAAAFARNKHRAVYISGEEAVAQVRLRAERLGLVEAAVELAAETSVEDIVATLSQGATPRLLVIDSIQTMWTQSVEAAPGTVTQVRGSAGELIRFAKRTGAAVILVGHVTKDGQIAGPRVVEHMVDAVLSFEGEGSHQFRILRAIKNRFGPTDEIGVFEMTGVGLREVANPSELFLSERELGSPGTAVFAGIEGTPPPRLARRGAPWSAGIRAAFRWCSQYWKRIAGSACPATTSTSTLPAGCASRNRQPTLPQRRLWYRRSSTPRCPPTPSTLGKYRCPEPYDRWRKPLPASRKLRSSASSGRSSRTAHTPKPLTASRSPQSGR
jgi:DNA repair protein RadA/Sms